MFNLLISADPTSWDEESSYELEKSRVAIEYTANEISERYKFLDKKAIEELKTFPTLFVIENEQTTSKIGYITDIRVRQKTVLIKFKFDSNFPELPIGAIKRIKDDVDLGDWELSRTHWAIKDELIFEILTKHAFINQDQINKSDIFRNPEPIKADKGKYNTQQVFIVHGHDDVTKLDMANFISDLNLQPIILHTQANLGLTIIEKIEHYSNVGFAVILYTPCDVGNKVGLLTGAFRARQNVVFEHGYFIAKLGRDRVSALVKGEVETPSDIDGIVYVSMDNNGDWKEQLKRELQATGYQVD